MKGYWVTQVPILPVESGGVGTGWDPTQMIISLFQGLTNLVFAILNIILLLKLQL